MYTLLPIFEMHLLFIAEKLEKRLPLADRTSGQLKRLLRAIDQHPNLPSFFSPELQNVHYILKRRLADDGAGMAAGGQHVESRLSYLRRDVDELRTFCVYLQEPMHQRKWKVHGGAVAEDLQMLLGADHTASLALRQMAHLNCTRKHDTTARDYAHTVLLHRQTMQALARTYGNKDILTLNVLQKASAEISRSFDTFKTAAGARKSRSVPRNQGSVDS